MVADYHWVEQPTHFELKEMYFLEWIAKWLPGTQSHFTIHIYIFFKFQIQESLSVIEYDKNSQNDKGSFLWRVESTPPSYFFGTIHVPYTRVWDAIPNNAKQAFAASKRVFFELDLTKPHIISTLSACQLLPKNRHLSQEIPSDLYAR